MLKIMGMLILFGLDWLYQKFMSLYMYILVVILLLGIVAVYKE